MTNQDESFFQEVEEAVRQDRYLDLAKKYGLWVVAAVALVLALVGGWVLYERWQVDQGRETAEQFAAAQKLLNENRAEEAAAAFEKMSKSGPQSYRVMAMMDRAQAMEMQGDMAGALAQFDAAAEAASDPVMKQTAQLRAAYLVAEDQDFQAVRARVEPIIEKGGPVSFLARELLAMEAMEAGDSNLARQNFEALTLAFETPEPVRERAQIALSVLPPAPTAATPPTSGEPK